MLLKDIDTAFRQDAARRVEHGIDIRVRDGEIAEIGEGLVGDETIDCRDKIALPGLINAHNHTANIITRGLSDDEALFPWLETNNRVLAEAERPEKRAGARLAAGLMLETGTTTVNDMWNTYLVEEFEALGIRACMGCALAETDDTEPETLRERFETNRSFIETYGDHPTIHPTVPVHSVYRGSKRLLRRAHDIVTEHDVPLHVHVSETARENELCRDETGMTPTAWLDDLGVLDRRSILVHCVHLTAEDRDRIAASGAGIAHCPASNLKLGAGIADVPAMTAADIPVAIGTDSAASNNSLNMIREARTAALVQKRTDPGALTAQRVLDMMTREAADVLGMADSLGSLEEGKRADIVLLDRDDPTLRPAIGEAGLLSNLIYSFHGRVETTIVNGEVVVEDGSVTTPIDDAMETVRAFCSAVAEGGSGPAS